MQYITAEPVQGAGPTMLRSQSVIRSLTRKIQPNVRHFQKIISPFLESLPFFAVESGRLY